MYKYIAIILILRICLPTLFRVIIISNKQSIYILIALKKLYNNILLPYLNSLCIGKYWHTKKYFQKKILANIKK